MVRFLRLHMPTSHHRNPCADLVSPLDVIAPSVDERRYRASLDAAQIFLTLRPGDVMEVIAHGIDETPMYTVTTTNRRFHD